MVTPPPSPPTALRSLRLRAVAADRWALVVAVLVVVALFGGWLVYATHVAPGTHVEEHSVTVLERTGSYDHRATVTRPNAVYPVGTTLANRPVYFPAISPVLEGAFVYRYDAPGDDPVTVTTRPTLVVRSTDRQGETEYWRVTRPLEAPRATTLSPGESVRVPFDVNATWVDATVERVRTDLRGDPGRPEVLVVTQTRTLGTVDGHRVDVADSYRMRVEVSGATYAVTVPETAARAVTATDRTTVPNSYGPLRAGGSVALVALAVAGLLGLAWARWTGRLAVTDAERARLAFAADRRAHDDWITSARVPDDAARRTVTVASLADLVDVAIDTNARVLEDRPRGRYLVPGDRFDYVYVPPPADG